MAISPSVSKFFARVQDVAAKSFGVVLFALFALGGMVVGSPYVLLRFWWMSFLALATSTRDLVMIKAPA